MTYQIIFYSNAKGNNDIATFLTNLSNSHQKNDIALMKKITHQLDMLTDLGPNLGMPQSKLLKGYAYPLYKLRPQPERIFYAVVWDNEILLLHHYTKRTNKTDQRQITKALNNLKDWLQRKG